MNNREKDGREREEKKKGVERWHVRGEERRQDGIKSEVLEEKKREVWLHNIKKLKKMISSN